MTLKNLAKILGRRFGVATPQVEVWLKARSITKTADLMRFGIDHKQSMDNALADFWSFAMER
jgi:hypothetical protein